MSDIGILARIPGEHIAQALTMLPDPESAEAKTTATDLYVPRIGQVRFSAELNVSKEGKSLHYFWTATKAELLP